TSTSPTSLPAPSPRLDALPTYVFAWLDELKERARARGARLIDLGIGNPDKPTPAPIIARIAEAYQDPATHGYPPFRGTDRFREAVSRFMRARFGVEMDPAREVLATSGAKEAIAHFTMAYADETSISLVPDIYYPVHGRMSPLVGSRVHHLPLRAERGFLPDLSAVPAEVLREARVLFLNYPHNPTGAVATLAFYEEAVAFCQRHHLVLLSDLAYSELTYDGFVAPSVFQVPGAKEVAIETHSFSKSFNMAGSRLGWACGNPELIDSLYAVRTNLGYGTPAAIQEGGIHALEHAREFVPEIRARYQARRDAVVSGFRRLGWPIEQPPRATMFVWLPVPQGFTSPRWAEHLIETADVVVTPGHAFGPGGEGWFRTGLVADVEVFEEVFARMERAGIRYGAGVGSEWGQSRGS
ncbi:MAG TPA: aminotransferase class I/II-fold pyridoxal phosphate-dependent enzyme, partial [Gemmatimonadaceae bacterium]|nr:aminotransferase class I/II-fold pyridoxal phosphate-dependent enzyme [Gemmatimonadaceae bacterium]